MWLHFVAAGCIGALACSCAPADEPTITLDDPRSRLLDDPPVSGPGLPPASAAAGATADGDCFDDNPCTVDARVAGICTHEWTPACCTLDLHCPTTDPCVVGLCIDNGCVFETSSAADCAEDPLDPGEPDPEPDLDPDPDPATGPEPPPAPGPCGATAWTRPLGYSFAPGWYAHRALGVAFRAAGGFAVVGVQDYESVWSYGWAAGLSPGGALDYEIRLSESLDRACATAVVTDGAFTLNVGYDDPSGYQPDDPWRLGQIAGAPLSGKLGEVGQGGFAATPSVPNGVVALDAASHPQGGAIVVGHRQRPVMSTAASDPWVARIDENGGTQWSQSGVYDNAAYEGAVSVAVRPNGNAVVLGWQRICNADGKLVDSGEDCKDGDPFLFEVNGDGLQLWNQVVAAPGDDRPTAVTLLDSGGIVFATQVPGGTGVFRIGAEKAVIWSLQWEEVSANALATTPDGSVAVAGERSGKHWLRVIDSTGAIVFDRVYSFEGAGAVMDVLPMKSGFVLAGYTGKYARLSKTDADGKVTCEWAP